MSFLHPIHYPLYNCYYEYVMIRANVNFVSLGACVDFDLGMESGTIPDRNIIASSEESASTPGKNGRLNYASGSSWCAGTSDTSPYLQVDLQTLHIICAVSTQGNSQADQWVKNYTLQLSTDGTTWTDYKEGGQVKVYRNKMWDNFSKKIRIKIYDCNINYEAWRCRISHRDGSLVQN